MLTTWSELHSGDVVKARTGSYWRVVGWVDAPTTRWLAAGGGGAERVFTLAILDGSREPITAPHRLSDPVDRVFELDRTEDRNALTALGAAFTYSTISEEEAPVTIDKPAECAHPANEISTLKTGAVICTGCFATLTPAPAGAIPAGPELPAPIAPIEVPPYAAMDSSGVEYQIPARDRKGACDAGIHPQSALGAVERVEGIWARPCSSCGLVMALTPGYVADLGLDQPVVVDALAAGPGSAALPDVTAAYQAAAAALVSVVEPAPVAPAVDVFADPAGFREVKRDRWGRYVLPDPHTGVERGWTRASTLARVLADEYNLERWKRRQTARGVALNKDLIAGIVACDVEDKKTLNELVDKAMERAESSSGATLGTALHNFTHRLDRGEPLASLRAPDPLGADLVEYQATMKRHGLTTVPGLVERIVVCPALGAAGTFDRIWQQRISYGSERPLTVGDLKTGRSVDWSWLEWAIQLAIYANATHMWDPSTNSYVEMPPPSVLDRDRALVLHLPVGQATGQVYGVNIIEGWEAAQVAEQARQYRNSGKGYGWLITPADPTALLVHRVSQADGPELARLWERHHPAGEWTEAVAAAAAERVARLTESVPA